MAFQEERPYLSELDIYSIRSNGPGTAAFIEFNGTTVAVDQIAMILPTANYTILLVLKSATGQSAEPLLTYDCRSRERMLHEYDKLRYCLQKNLIAVRMTDDYNHQLTQRER